MSIYKVINDLQKLANTPDLPGTAKILFQALGEEGIPAVYCGGFAMHGYGGRRPTEDIDIIVPGSYKGKITDLLWKTLKPRFQGSTMKYTCRQTGVDVDVIYAGKKMDANAFLLPPDPSEVTSSPVPVSLEQLVTMKLDANQGNPILRAHDLGDIVELIRARSLPRDMDLPAVIKPLYEDVWDKVHKALNNLVEEE